MLIKFIFLNNFKEFLNKGNIDARLMLPIYGAY